MAISDAKPEAAAANEPLTRLDLALYTFVVLAWSGSWLAIKYQLGEISPIVSLFWRFGAAAILMFAWVVLSGRRMRFPAKDHIRFVAMGICLFSTNFLMFYFAGEYVTSGLLAVAFSFASIINMLLAWLFYGQRIGRRSAGAALIGVAGIGAMFWPEIVGTEIDDDALFGLMLCLLGTLSFCLGNMVAVSVQGRGLPMVSSNAWGMAYGTVYLGVIAVVTGGEFAIEWTSQYLLSLVFLTTVSTIGAFATYLTLVRRIGPGRAGYATVLFPVGALMISTFAEGYEWTLPAIVGLIMVILGNMIILTPRSSR